MSEITAIGTTPNVDITLVGSLLWAPAGDVSRVLELVQDSDVESVALAEVLAAIRRLVAVGKPHGPQMVLDELRRVGAVRNHNGVCDSLKEAVTSGADHGAAWHYAGAVVAASFRRSVDTYGSLLTTAARDADEHNLASHVDAATRVLGNRVQRLKRLRGDSL